jgi:hypothetical protein
MPEPIRTDNSLTTADLAGTSSPRTNPASRPDPPSRESEPTDRPLLVRNTASPQSDMGERAASVKQTAGRTDDTASLLPDAELTDLRSQWSNIQAGFVDEPQRSVKEADQLVAAAMQRLAERFARERAELEKQWDSGDNVSTEDLRLALQRYRSFFGRLLNAA